MSKTSLCQPLFVSRGQRKGMPRLETCQEHFSHTPGSQDFPNQPRIAPTLSLSLSHTNSSPHTTLWIHRIGTASHTSISTVRQKEEKKTAHFLKYYSYMLWQYDTCSHANKAHFKFEKTLQSSFLVKYRLWQHDSEENVTLIKLCWLELKWPKTEGAKYREDRQRFHRRNCSTL